MRAQSVHERTWAAVRDIPMPARKEEYIRLTNRRLREWVERYVRKCVAILEEGAAA